jgi:hypothetical protein
VGIQQSFGSTAKNAAKYAIAVDLGLAEIWLGRRLVNGGKCGRFEAPAAFAAGLYQELQIDTRRWKSLIFVGAPLISEVRVGGSARVHELRKQGASLSRISSF